MVFASTYIFFSHRKSCYQHYRESCAVFTSFSCYYMVRQLRIKNRRGKKKKWGPHSLSSPKVAYSIFHLSKTTVKCRKCLSYLQEGQKGRSEELQASQSHLNPMVSGGANNPRKQFQTHKGHKGDQESAAQIYKGEIMLNQPGNLLQ